MSKKVLVIGDLHCGSMCGITPPGWIVSKKRNAFFSSLQEEMWERYVEMVNHFGHVDSVVVNGDVIDGKGIRSGGTELITNDMLEQVEMATSVLSELNTSQFYFTYGTPYHTSSQSGEDFDKLVADNFDANIYDVLHLKVEDVLFNISHKVGSSSSPYNRAQPVGKHRLWDTLHCLRNDDEAASVFIRSHVHYFSFCGESKWTAFTLPALQTSQTKYGARQCVGNTDWGMCMIKVDHDLLAGWDCQMVELASEKKKIVSVK